MGGFRVEGLMTGSRGVGHTGKGFLVGLRAIEVALGDIGPLNAHLPYLAGGRGLVVLVQGSYLHMQHQHSILSTASSAQHSTAPVQQNTNADTATA